ncbi:MAG TPA: PKD domain-containing protein [Bacteroidia bacterium]|nr:PKD domain-containing protein [Bacteroidia bacterium]
MKHRYTLKNIIPLILFICGLFMVESCFSQSQNINAIWTVNPFDSKVFIENLGQVDSEVVAQVNTKILYTARIGSIQAYFTSNGVLYKHEEFLKRKGRTENEEEEEDENSKPVVRYFNIEWKNSNTKATIDAEQEQTYYYSYAGSNGEMLKANAFKKITYRNLYQGIDVEYILPEGKNGIKYSVIIHPGADISQLKLIYKGARSLKAVTNGNIIINSELGIFTDHSPVSYYEGETQNIKTSYLINGKEESFSIDQSYDKNKTLVIDPWTTNPGFGGWINAANDVDYDYNGNVYAYGSYGPPEIAKLNSAGVVQWIFTPPMIKPYGPFCYQYGGFCVDRSTGDCFISEAVATAGLAAGAKTLKISTAGAITGMNVSDTTLNEIWKSAFNQCTHQIIVAGGGALSPSQAAIIDASTMTTVTKPANVLSAVGKAGTSYGKPATLYYHDLFGVTVDPAGGICYMGSTKSNVNPGTDDLLLKVPIPALLPITYKNYLDGSVGLTYPYKFQEGYINAYSPNNTSIGNPNSFSNSFNGMAAGYQSWVYVYDGTTLTQFNKASGSIASKTIVYNWIGILGRNDSIRWGGLDVDPCENIYTGVRDSINVYNSALSLTSKISVKDTIYGLRVGLNNYKTATQTLYACGLGYVSSLTVASRDTVTLNITKTNASKCTCNGKATAHFRMTCGDTANLSYNWSDGQTTQTATNLCPGNYTVTVSLSACNSVQYQDTVNITSPPGALTLTKTFIPVTCNGGNNGTANVNASGGIGPYTYSWAPGGGSLANISNLSAGSYTCTVKDSGGCSDTAIINITQPKALFITTTSKPAACGNPTGSMNATVTGGTGTYNYVWAPGGSTSTGATNVPAGTYSVNIADGNGCKDSAVIIITNTPAITGNISPVTNVLCNGGNTGTATGNVTSGASPYTYSWSNGQSSSAATNLGVGNYTLTITDKNGCIIKDSVTITQPPALVIKMSSTSATCGQSNGVAAVTASGGTGSYSYTWNPGGGSTVAITNIIAGTYTITVTDSNSCALSANVTVASMSNDTAKIIAVSNVRCFGQSNGSASVIVTGGSGPYTYLWSDGQSSSGATNLGVGSYTVNVTDTHGCISADSIHITQPIALMPNAGPNQMICIGKPGVINASATGGTSPYIYTWNTGATTSSITIFPATTTSYAVEVTDSNGCISPPISVTITIRPPLSVSATSTGPICNGDTAKITAMGHGGDSAYVFNWMPGNVSGASTNVSPTVSTYYTVTVTDGCADTVKDSVEVIVTPAPIINFTLDTLSGCSPLCVQFKDMTTATGGISSWSWNFGDGTTSSNQNPLHCFNNPGNYSVGLFVTSNSGCKASQISSGLITVYSHPQADFSYSPNTITEMDPLVQFTDLSKDAYGINAWYWTFGDSYNSSLQNPTHSYSDTGRFCTTLKVTNKHGCTDTITECLDIQPIFTIYIPNAFTPDANGLNDIFTAKGVGIKTFEMWIFDRWGQQLYYTTNIYTGWDGKVQGGTSGQIVQEDTYVYLIEVIDIFNKPHKYLGKVSVIK